MKKTARLPSSEAAKRIAVIFHRQLSTKWSEKEIKTFRQLVKDGYLTDLTGLALIERCYRMQWPPRREKNILRHDLATFLNHFSTELDRATAWCEAHPEKPKPRVIIQLPPIPSEPFIQTPEAKERTDRFMAEYRARKKVSDPKGADSVQGGNASDSGSVTPKSFRSSFQKVQSIMEGTA